MNISVFGLGYVGTVSAACLARDGHRVIGVDVNAAKVDLINEGVAPIVERDIGPLVHAGRTDGRLSATLDVQAAVSASELSLVCVGTPSQRNGDLDVAHVRGVCEQIGRSLARKSGYHVVVVRSTMLPGTMRRVVLPALESASGKRAGADFGVCVNPEFLREGTAVWDYDHPPKTVIGATDERAAAPLRALYAHLSAPLFEVQLETAEMVKYTDNAWHALKVAFANEIGSIAKAVDVDSHAVMDIFCADTKLNLSPYYLKPGFSFGGSCLPKDVRALAYKSRQLDLHTPLLSAILPSNEAQTQRGIDLVLGAGKKRIGVLGFSFKADTDDLRESPLVALIETLIGKGYELRLYDRNVSLAALTGANRDYILNHIPHISGLMVDSLDKVLEFADVVVIGNGAKEFQQVPHRLRGDQALVDLVRIPGDVPSNVRYEGICW